MAITNTMVGSVALCLPYSFQSGGFYSSIIVCVIMGIVSYLTCRVLVKNQ